MIHSSSQGRKAGGGAVPPPSTARAQAQPRPGDDKAAARPARKAGGKPVPERKGEATPATPLRQRGRAAPPTEGRHGPAAQFFERVAQLPPSLNPILGVRLDDTTRTAVIALDSTLYIEQHLANSKGSLTPALMEELSAFSRKMTLEGPDITTGLVYSTFLDNADVTRLTPELVKPVFRSMLQGPPYLAADRLALAVKAVCALFPDCVLPQAWRGALLQAARESLEPGNAQAIADVTTAILYAAMMVVNGQARRAEMDQENLRLALEACVDDPERPVGLVSWMNGAATHSQPLDVATRVLDALRAMPDLAPHPTAAVLVALSAGTVMPLATDGTAPGEPLRLILPWALQLPDSHRGMALNGIAQGMGEGTRTTQASPAHLRTVLRVIGALEDRIQAAGAQSLVGKMLAQVIVSADDDETPAQRRKGAESKSALKPAAGGDTKAGASRALGEDWPAQALAALRAVLAGTQVHDVVLEHRLIVLGHGLAAMAGGKDIASPCVRAFTAGLAESSIPARLAAQVLSGLAYGAGGPALKDEVLRAFIDALARAELVRGAVLACHLCAVLGAAGAPGRPLAVPLDRRMAQVLGEPLPPPLALGCQLADSPLVAVRQQPLARGQQLLLLEAALEMPGGLGDARLEEQAFNCAVLATEDLDFAFEVAQRLCEQLDTPPGEALVRQLRSALITQVIASAVSPDGIAALDRHLNHLARLYERVGRSLWVAQAQSEMETELEVLGLERKGPRPATTARPAGPGPFLASEAALMRGGPHAALLEPLAAKLAALGEKLGGITVSSTLTASL